jgi:hypothetical protein
MTTQALWAPGPEGQVLVAGECRARDADGQGCAHGVLHPLSPHQGTGLRSWLESTEDRAIIRIYDATRADALEAMETPLFARFEFRPIARQEVVQTKDGGLSSGWVFLVGIWAPTEEVQFRVRAVCFARPW